MLRHIFFTALGILLVSSCGKLTVDNSVIDTLDVNRFAGKWYEIARYDHWFERGMTHTTATYTLQTDGTIKVVNAGRKNGKAKDITGKARTTEQPALLRVSFFGPFYSDYRILMLGKDYDYALIGGSTDNYLWILARQPALTPAQKERIMAEAQRRGYDLEQIIWIEQ